VAVASAGPYENLRYDGQNLHINSNGDSSEWHPFYSQYSGQPALASTLNWRILLKQSFTAHMTLLMATVTIMEKMLSSRQECVIES